MKTQRAILEDELAQARHLLVLCGDDREHRLQIAKVLRKLSRFDSRARKEKLALFCADPNAKAPDITARGFDIPTVRVRAAARS